MEQRDGVVQAEFPATQRGHGTVGELGDVRQQARGNACPLAHIAV